MPSHVVVAIRVMWGLLIVAAILVLLPIALLILSAGMALSDLVPLAGVLIVFGLLALLVRSVSHGRNWARLVYSAVAVLAILAICVSIFRAPDVGLFDGILRVAAILLYAVVLYLLFQPASSRWFKGSNEGAP